MAVHILTMLAKSPHGNLKSEYIASSVNTNAVVIRRLLGQLSHANLVVSQTGAFGGTRLAKDPGEINMFDVYRAVCFGEVFALHPKGVNQDCPVGRHIEAVLCRLQKEIDRTLGEKLSQFTLRDLIDMAEPAAA